MNNFKVVFSIVIPWWLSGFVLLHFLNSGIIMLSFQALEIVHNFKIC